MILEYFRTKCAKKLTWHQGIDLRAILVESSTLQRVNFRWSFEAAAVTLMLFVLVFMNSFRQHLPFLIWKQGKFHHHICFDVFYCFLEARSCSLISHPKNKQMSLQAKYLFNMSSDCSMNNLLNNLSSFRINISLAMIFSYFVWLRK